jgi:NAD+ synthase (glutamine-hydrolysing)
LLIQRTSSLNQWALDFEGNAARIIENVKLPKLLEPLCQSVLSSITGYGCLDRFLEGDTFLHSWEMFARIIDHPDCQYSYGYWYAS